MEKFLIGLNYEKIINFNEWKIGNERVKRWRIEDEQKERKYGKNEESKVGESEKDESWEEKETSRKMYIRNKMKEMWKRKWRQR